MRIPTLPSPLGWHSFLAIWILGLFSAVWPIPAILLTALLFFLDRTLWRSPRLCLAFLLGILAYCTASSQFSPFPRQELSATNAQGDRVAKVCGTITSVRSLNDQRLRILLEDACIIGKEPTELAGLVAWTWEKPVLRPGVGQRACISRTLKPVHSFANEGLADFSHWWYAQGVSWQLWSRGEQGAPDFQQQYISIATKNRENLYHSFVSILQHMQNGSELSQAQAMLLALIFGERFFLSQKTINIFADAALAHSLALSGQHLAVVALAGIFCVMCLAWRKPEMYLYTAQRRWSILFSIPPALVYLWLGNAPASLIRAFCMLCLLVIFQFLSRQRTLLDILALAMAVILVAWPAGIMDTGLQLSVACMFVIGATVAVLRKIRLSCFFGCSTYGRCAKFVVEIFLVSFSLQIALFPVNLLLFHNCGYWFPLNILWIPLVSFIVLPFALLGTLALFLGIPSIAEPLFAISTVPCEWILQLLSYLEQHGLLQQSPLLRPFWTGIPATGCLIAALAIHLCGRNQQTRTLKMRLAAAGFLFSLFGPLLHFGNIHSTDIEFTMFDVGQGQALGLRVPGNVRILIDGGGSYSRRFDVGKSILMPALSYNNSPLIDALIATHPDMDHIGGLFHIIKHASPSLVFDNGDASSKGLAKDWQNACSDIENRRLGAGDIIEIGPSTEGLRLHVLHPPHTRSVKDSQSWRDNDASLVLRLTRHGQGLLLMSGDAGPAVLQRLLQSGQELTAQILVASHHGSDHNFLPSFVETVKPVAVLASCGFQNRFGFPGKALTNWLKTRSIPFYHTDNSGALIATWSDKGALTIRSVREGALLHQKNTDL